MRPNWSMRIAIWSAFLVLALAVSTDFADASPKQAGGARQSVTFEPLLRWRAGVLAGDRAALSQFYSTTPPAQAKTADGSYSDPDEEPLFWSALAAQHIANLNPKILQIVHQPDGTIVLVLRIEFSLGPDTAQKPFVVGGGQFWMKQGTAWKIVYTERSDLAPREAERLPEPTTPNVNLYPPTEQASADVQTALAAAAKDHKRVLLVFGGNWCYDCHVLDSAFHSAKIAPLLAAAYHLVHVNIGNMDTNLDIAQKYQVPIDKGVPALAVLAPDGSVVFSQKNGEFESSVALAPQDVIAFLQKWKPATGR
jgi:thioredoxin 1